MSAQPMTVSAQSARSVHAAHALRARRVAVPSLVRVLVGVVLLAVGLLAWVAGQWSVAERGWAPGAVVAAQGTVVEARDGQELVLWVPRSFDGELPSCRANDLVYDQRLTVSAPASQLERTVGRTVHVAAGTFTAGSSSVRVACPGAETQVAVAPQPDGPAVLRDGRWTVLVAMLLGLGGVLLLGRELLGTELTAPVRPRRS